MHGDEEKAAQLDAFEGALRKAREEAAEARLAKLEDNFHAIQQADPSLISPNQT